MRRRMGAIVRASLVVERSADRRITARVFIVDLADELEGGGG